MGDRPNNSATGIAHGAGGGAIERPRTVLYCCADLLWATRVKGTGEGVGVACRPVRSVEMLTARLGDCDVAGLLLDLEAGEVCFELMAALQQAGLKQGGANVPVVAFAPHVHVDLMKRASASGATAVLARGAFAGRMPAILTDLAARGRAPASQMED